LKPYIGLMIEAYDGRYTFFLTFLILLLTLGYIFSLLIYTFLSINLHLSRMCFFVALLLKFVSQAYNQNVIIKIHARDLLVLIFSINHYIILLQKL
jgi:hypothetical protein